jgi:CRISPR-associated protein Cas1
MKRTIEISTSPAHLAVRHGQLLLKRDGETFHQAPCEDLGAIVVNNQQSSYTHHALVALARAGATVILCDDSHLPAVVVLPLSEHSTIGWRLADQIAAGAPLKKQLWRQLVRAKISGQSRNIDPELPARKKLKALADEVRSGDPANIEAQAARVYWQNWLWSCGQLDFRRDQDGGGLNAFLNYGYAVVRAAIGRAIVAAGLHPSLGIHHHHRANAFCLADDLIEPFRPLVDERVCEMHRLGHESLNAAAKAELLGLLARPMRIGSERMVLTAAIQRTVFSLTECFAGRSRRLVLPEVTEVD